MKGFLSGVLSLFVLFLAVAPAATQEPPRPQATCVDLNSAAAAALQRIVQIGPARAQQIIALRTERPFRSVDDLTRVNGIAAGRLAEIKAQGLACVRETPESAGLPLANVPPASADSSKVRQNSTSCVDLNKASLQDLQRIVQIGPARAQQIVALRKQKPFASVDELTRVNGIGAARIAAIKAQGVACVR